MKPPSGARNRNQEQRKTSQAVKSYSPHSVGIRLMKQQKPLLVLGFVTSSTTASTTAPTTKLSRVGQNRIYTVHIHYFGLEFTKYTVYIHVHIRFWPTLNLSELASCYVTLLLCLMK